jgi:hypothetical protein
MTGFLVGVTGLGATVYRSEEIRVPVGGRHGKGREEVRFWVG